MSRLDRGQRRLLALAVASQASISIALWGLGALGPELQDEFGLSAAALGALLAAGFIGNAVILIPAGTLVDRIGPRTPLIVGGLVSGVVLVAAGLAPSAVLVGVALFGYGLTAAFVSVAGTVSVFHGFSADRRGMALGVRQMAVSAGGLVAAGLLPGLAAVGGVRLSLIVSGVLAAVFAAPLRAGEPARRAARGFRGPPPDRPQGAARDTGDPLGRGDLRGAGHRARRPRSTSPFRRSSTTGRRRSWAPRCSPSSAPRRSSRGWRGGASPMPVAGGDGGRPSGTSGSSP